MDIELAQALEENAEILSISKLLLPRGSKALDR